VSVGRLSAALPVALLRLVDSAARSTGGVVDASLPFFCFLAQPVAHQRRHASALRTDHRNALILSATDTQHARNQLIFSIICVKTVDSKSARLIR